MKAQIIDRNSLLDDATHELTERRLLFAFSRFDPRIRRVACTFDDANGPRGGIDIACRIVVSLHGADDVVISEKDESVERCVSRAAERAGRAVARAIDRALHKSRDVNACAIR